MNFTTNRKPRLGVEGKAVKLENVTDKVNNEGKTNEATKNLKEPLQKGQTAPKTASQQQQQDKPKKNNKGMKM